MLPEHTVELADGRQAGQHESAQCQWTGKILPSDMATDCRLCGLRVDKRLLNSSGEFSVLREIVDGK